MLTSDQIKRLAALCGHLIKYDEYEYCFKIGNGGMVWNPERDYNQAMECLKVFCEKNYCEYMKEWDRFELTIKIHRQRMNDCKIALVHGEDTPELICMAVLRAIKEFV